MKLYKLLKSCATGFLMLALAIVVMGVTKVSADDAELAYNYNPNTDCIDVTGVSGSAIWFYKFSSNEAKEIGARNYTKLDVSGSAISIALYGDSKLKITETKDLYLFITDVAPADAKVEKGPNFTVSKSAYKSITVQYNYAKASAGVTESAITSVTCKGYDKDTADTVISGSALNASFNLYYSVDGGTTWKPAITGDDKQLTGEKLYELCTKMGDRTGKPNVQFKILGNAKNDETPAVRNTPAKKSNPAKITELKSVKIDFVKGTAAIKNGMDYCVKNAAVASPSTIAIGDWTVILPYNKKSTHDAATTFANTFAPAAKFVDDEADSAAYTNKKVSSLLLSEICADAWGNDGTGKAYIYARKSATAKKPATTAVQVGGIKVNGETTYKAVAAPAVAPTIATTGAIVIATTTEGAIKVPTITAVGNITNAAFEYAVVRKTDLDNNKIDMSSIKWTKIGTPADIATEKGKTIKPASMKCNYKLIATDIAGRQIKVSDTLTTDCYILVRTGAVKNESLASNYAKTVMEAATADGVTTFTWKYVAE